MRPPGNVPYLVDNLWEWSRPTEFPNRRLCAFASPTKELALSSITQKAEDYKVGSVILQGNSKIAQIENVDAKFYKDVKTLPKCFLDINKNWTDFSVNEKLPLGKLFMPCLTRDEVEEVLSLPEHMEYYTKLKLALTFWTNAKLITDKLLYEQGEIFFEYSAYTIEE